MAEFTYNTTKNTSNGHAFFELNYGYYPWVYFKDKLNPYSRSRFANELVKKMGEFMSIY